MVVDDRIIVLMRQRSVSCELRKQPRFLSVWFYEQLDTYNRVFNRPDVNSNPLVKGVKNDLFTLLKFVALPNNRDKKVELIEARWPELKDRIEALG